MAAGVSTFDTTAIALTGYALPVQAYVRLKAAAANTQKVYVGHDSTVSATTGFELSAGNTLDLSRADAPFTSEVFLVAASGTQAVCWLTEIHGDPLTAYLASSSFATGLDFSLAEDSGYLNLL